MINVSIIGSGNVAQHLIRAFANSNSINIVQVFSRHPEAVSHLLPMEKITSGYNLDPADIYIIAVTDSAIAEVSASLPFSGRLVVHTSGSTQTGILDSKNRKGAFYPLQTFSKNKEVDFRSVPICIEAENEQDYLMLSNLAETVSQHVYRLDSEQRKSLHVAAVFASNFTNHMYFIAESICTENKIPFSILKPLIGETADKIMTLSPVKAQTGPAVRNDLVTIESHLSFLTDENRKKIYELLTNSIQHAKEL
ncbi:MAG TPA: F420-dependent NADP oxidoreductase [Flavobacterium sp.]|jgi:predicted short-subunit dehydrogenase-like oxidoreductase (DUF2520 family)